MAQVHFGRHMKKHIAELIMPAIAEGEKERIEARKLRRERRNAASRVQTAKYRAAARKARPV
jgi:hypothetical protein